MKALAPELQALKILPANPDHEGRRATQDIDEKSHKLKALKKAKRCHLAATSIVVAPPSKY
jgi:hypothetical protein